MNLRYVPEILYPIFVCIAFFAAPIAAQQKKPNNHLYFGGSNAGCAPGYAGDPNVNTANLDNWLRRAIFFAMPYP